MSTQSSRNKSWNVLNWNIRRINNEDKQKAVRAKIEEGGCVVFCLQETKKENIDCKFLKKVAPKRFSKFAFVPSEGASGGHSDELE
jgi:exonuclease III